MTVEMTYRLHGAFPYRVAVIHGGPGAPGTVSSLARKLGCSRGVIEPFQTAHSVRGQIAELHEQLGSHADPPVVLIGHSWGAWLSWLFAAEYPSCVSRLILAACPAFDPSYLPEMQSRRLAKLSSAERDEYLSLVELLQNPSSESSSRLSRLGELARKADHVCIDDTDENREDPVAVDGEGYRQVWGEASRMRETGEILSFASSIRCPVCVIHGLEDSTPIEGVVRPIEPLLPGLSVHGIPRAGHYPWKERYASELFYDVLDREIEEGLKR